MLPFLMWTYITYSAFFISVGAMYVIFLQLSIKL